MLVNGRVCLNPAWLVGSTQNRLLSLPAYQLWGFKAGWGRMPKARKKLRALVCGCNLHTGKVESGESLWLSLSRWPTGSVWHTISKKKNCEEQLRKALDSTVWFLHMCSQAHAFTHIHTQSDVSNGGSQGRVIISKYKEEKLWEHNMSL